MKYMLCRVNLNTDLDWSLGRINLTKSKAGEDTKAALFEHQQTKIGVGIETNVNKD